MKSALSIEDLQEGEVLAWYPKLSKNEIGNTFSIRLIIISPLFVAVITVSYHLIWYATITATISGYGFSYVCSTICYCLQGTVFFRFQCAWDHKWNSCLEYYATENFMEHHGVKWNNKFLTLITRNWYLFCCYKG